MRSGMVPEAPRQARLLVTAWRVNHGEEDVMQPYARTMTVTDGPERREWSIEAVRRKTSAAANGKAPSVWVSHDAT
jgi:hypothetical protein